MRHKPVDIHEMFRNAIRSQIDMGMSEIVVTKGKNIKDWNLPEPKAVSQSILPVTEAINNPTAQQSFGQQPFSPIQIQPSVNRFEDNGDEEQYASLDEHYQAICDCMLCPLGKTRTKLVYGVGNPKADIMFIGEAPGADEDKKGEPFVGRAGQLLDKIIIAMELSRKEVYIANILKCRPPGNRDPQPDEMNKCGAYLRQQIRLISPKILCLLGRVAAQALLNTTTPLGRLRSQWHHVANVPTIVTYHPAALLRFSSYKKDTWADMQELLRRYKEMR